MTEMFGFWLWAGFFIFLIIALTLDTILLKQHVPLPNQSIKAALMWTMIWIMAALIFNVILWIYLRAYYQPAIANSISLEFFAGYLIEKTLAIDNLFAFYMIFNQLRIPIKYQQRVFTYGIWGAIIMRLLFITLLSFLIHRFQWLIYIMGLFLLLTGLRMLFFSQEHGNKNDNKLLAQLKTYFRITPTIRDESFFVKRKSIWLVTPLFIALIAIEISDLIFAFDSIPAIFAITQEPFIVWSSNVFAILGLRALYFVLAGMVYRFVLLKYGLSLIMIYIGIKMLLMKWVHIPITVSLTVIISILLLFILMSYLYQIKRKEI